MAVSEKDLMSASNHLFYEIWMFYETAGILKRDPQNNAVFTNVHLESFAIHSRVLLDFFYNEPKQDDVVAIHYIKNWKDLCPAIGDDLKKISPRVGKEVAHLTYARLQVTPEAKSWDTRAVEREMELVIKKFQSNAPHNLIVEKLFQLKPAQGLIAPTPTTSAQRFYATNTGAWLYRP